MLSCSYCKSKIFEEDRYCPRCGAPAGEATSYGEGWCIRSEYIYSDNEGNIYLGKSPVSTVTIKFEGGESLYLFEDVANRQIKVNSPRFFSSSGIATYECEPE